MNYIVTKPIKSKGIAALLVFIFGGLGLFYASIVGGIIMGIVAPIAVYFFLILGVIKDTMSLIVIVIIFCCLYYILCLIWALNAVSNYNKKIIAESNYANSNLYQDNTSTNAYSGNQYEEKSRSNLWIWILFFLLLGSIIFLLYYKGIILEKQQPIKEKENLKTIPNEIIKPKKTKEELKYY